MRALCATLPGLYIASDPHACGRVTQEVPLSLISYSDKNTRFSPIQLTRRPVVNHPFMTLHAIS